MNLAKYIDHTMLKACAAQADIELLCKEALQYGFASVCVNPFWVPFCARLLKGGDVKVCTVVGFPLGACGAAAKAFEADLAVKEGAEEIDMVINIGALKSGLTDIVGGDIKAVREACAGKILKVIIETSYLTDAEKETACKIAAAQGADFVKTSTGFSGGGATEEDVKLMLKAGGIKVKASGGIKTRAAALKMINAGAARLGTSSGVKIIED
ncbi:MAG: deoxyribose-phosphate aldolase [Elusimicrobiota bacterium]|jgi:deoxyribose-phosphate aldolase|nr:deoxyribose-phosphate aldolase [Elusimicrobiota bacterium]